MARPLRPWPAAAACLLATSCLGGTAPSAPARPVQIPRAPVRLRAAPAWVRDACATVAAVRRLCPAVLPTGPPELDLRLAPKHPSSDVPYGAASFVMVGSDNELSCDPGDRLRRRPPQCFGVVVAAGPLDQTFRTAWPGPGAVRKTVGNAPVRRRTRTALLLGRPRWYGVARTLILAPDLPWTPFSDDLVFRWGSRSGERAIALSAWRPLREAVTTLQVLVGRTPQLLHVGAGVVRQPRMGQTRRRARPRRLLREPPLLPLAAGR